MLKLEKNDKILVIAAHPDDEVLGCAGTVAKYASLGHECHTLIMAEGLTSRTDKRDAEAFKKEMALLQQTSQKANAAIGVKDVQFAGCPDNRMDSMDLLDVTKIVENHIAKIKPAVVFTHYASDLNVDHQIVNRAVMTALRPQAFDNVVKTILFFEIASSTEWKLPHAAAFNPNVFVDISPYWEKKLKALEAYQSEMREWPHPRSIKGVDVMAQFRGSTAGFDRAEAFILGRAFL